MAGITSIAAYIPRYRLTLQEIGKMWGAKGGKGQRAVAGYDEDAITMAVAAGLGCMKGTGRAPDALYFATTTAPYKEKQNAAIIAGAVDANRECRTADFANSLRAGTTALKAAIDAVKSSSSTHALVIAADSRVGAPKGRFEQLLGDGACALMIGEDAPIAEIQGNYSIFSDFTDLWRGERMSFCSPESPILSMRQESVMEEVLNGLLATQLTFTLLILKCILSPISRAMPRFRRKGVHFSQVRTRFLMGSQLRHSRSTDHAGRCPGEGIPGGHHPLCRLRGRRRCLYIQGHGPHSPRTTRPEICSNRCHRLRAISHVA